MSGKPEGKTPQQSAGKHEPMDREAAARIQAAADRPGPGGDPGFKARAQAAAARNQPATKK